VHSKCRPTHNETQTSSSGVVIVSVRLSCEVPVSMRLPEYDGCPCVCAERWRWMSLT